MLPLDQAHSPRVFLHLTLAMDVQVMLVPRTAIRSDSYTSYVLLRESKANPGYTCISYIQIGLLEYVLHGSTLEDNPNKLDKLDWFTLLLAWMLLAA